MASITKNPIVLQSVNYINSWFKTQIKDKKTMSLFNSLETIESDQKSIKNLERIKQEKKYYDFDTRYKEVVGEEDV